MTSELLDKTKVQDALIEAKNNITFRTQFYGNLSSNPLEAFNDSIRCAIHEEAKLLIKEAFDSFVDQLHFKLNNCEPDIYPCALCHEEKDEKNT